MKTYYMPGIVLVTRNFARIRERGHAIMDLIFYSRRKIINVQK